MHTNLEFADEENGVDAINCYDMLCESGLLIKIIDTFKDDYASCQEILNMMTTDVLQNSMTIEKKIHQVLDFVKEIFSNGVNSLVENLDLDSLGDLDQDKLMKLYELISTQE